MSSSSSNNGLELSGSSSVDSPNLQSPGPPPPLTSPPSTYGGLLRRILTRDQLREAVVDAALTLEDEFHNDDPPPAEATLRSYWNNLARAAFLQQKKTYRGLKLLFQARDEVSLLKVQVADGPSYDSIEFNKILLKAVEDGKRVRAMQRLSVPQPISTTTPPPAVTDAELLERYGLTHTPILPHIPGLRSRPSSFAPSSATEDETATTAGINSPDGGMTLQRHVQSASSNNTDDPLSHSLDQHTQLLLSVSEVKVLAEARKGLAQAMCYLLSAFKACGTWLGFLCIDLAFVRMVILGDSLLAIETKDHELQGKAMSPWDLFKHFSSDVSTISTHSIEVSAGCHVFADTVYEVQALGAVIPTDQPLSRLPSPNGVRSWRKVEAQAIRTHLPSTEEQLYLASEARRDTIGRVYLHMRQTMLNLNPASVDKAKARPRRLGAMEKRNTTTRSGGSTAPRSSGTGSGSGRRYQRPNFEQQPGEDMPTVDTLASLAQDSEVDEADFLVAALLHHGLRIAFVSPNEMSTMIQERVRETVALIQKGSMSADRSTIKQASPAIATSVNVELSQ